MRPRHAEREPRRREPPSHSRSPAARPRPAVAPETSIEKALAVLAAFNGPMRSRSISDLADELGLPRPTVHRILKQLVGWRFVQQLPCKRYQLGSRLFELGTLFYHQMQLRRAAGPRLHALFEATRASIYLSVHSDAEVLHLDCIPAKSAGPIAARAGGRWNMHCSSVGKVLLAHRPAEEIAEYLSRPLQPLTRFSIRDAGRLLEELETVRRQGFGTTVQESIVGVYGVAAAISDVTGQVVAAVCVASVDPRVLDRSPDVVGAARDISRELSRLHGR